SGPSGVLPAFFTEVELVRQKEKDTALKDFLDIFNHRTISLFYRAWEKYRLTYNYERAALHQLDVDPLTALFESLAGIDGKALKKYSPFNNEELIYYSGLFASPKRTAIGLQTSMAEYLNVPVKVNQFKGEWLDLLEDDRSRLPAHPFKGRNNCLGVDMVIGEKFFTVEGKFEIELGPLNKSEYFELLPGSKKYKALMDYVKLYSGNNYTIDLKYKIYSKDVTPWSLDEKEKDVLRLGWNTWFHLGENSPELQTVVVNNG
ncbi:MAG: type VI secretion system baseplate subunit TssG, partial [Gammaproteobacteria bacterium]|nr:type VI secretion system baseplate subunit TssG [Gammaproteobacteria bacterium]